MKNLAGASNILSFLDRKPNFEAARQKILLGDTAAAMTELGRLAASGDAHAHTMIGMMYETGRDGVLKDQKEAIYHYSVAIDSVGALEAWLGLARICSRGDEHVRDYKRAERCYRIVSEDANHSVAWLGLGRLYRDGLGVDVNYSYAHKCLQRALDLGNKQAYHELGLLAALTGHSFRAIGFQILSILLSNGDDRVV